MALFNLKTLGKHYTTKVKCRNCGHIFDLRVPKGITVESYVLSGDAKCEECECGTLNMRSSDAKPEPQQAGKYKKLGEFKG